MTNNTRKKVHECEDGDISWGVGKPIPSQDAYGMTLNLRGKCSCGVRVIEVYRQEAVVDE